MISTTSGLHASSKVQIGRSRSTFWQQPYMYDVIINTTRRRSPCALRDHDEFLGPGGPACWTCC